MRYSLLIIAYFFGGFTGFLMCSLFAIRSINRMEREMRSREEDTDA